MPKRTIPTKRTTPNYNLYELAPGNFRASKLYHLFSCPAFLSPEFSCPATWFVIFLSCIFSRSIRVQFENGAFLIRNIPISVQQPHLLSLAFPRPQTVTARRMMSNHSVIVSNFPRLPELWLRRNAIICSCYVYFDPNLELQTYLPVLSAHPVCFSRHVCMKFVQ